MKKRKQTLESAINNLKSLYPHSQPGDCKVTKLDSWQNYCLAIKEKEHWAEKADFLKLQFMHSMKEKDTLTHENKVLATWKSREVCIVDGKYLKSNYPDIWLQCAKVQSIRYFMPKLKSQDE
jgi:hypothetical protein